jgi:hypothetical protein
MDILTQRFRHFRSSNVGNSMKCQAIVDLVVLIEILSNRIDHEAKKIRVLMHQQRHSKIPLPENKRGEKFRSLISARAYNLFLTVFVARDQIHRFHMAHIDFVAQYVCIENLRDISAGGGSVSTCDGQ